MYKQIDAFITLVLFFVVAFIGYRYYQISDRIEQAGFHDASVSESDVLIPLTDDIDSYFDIYRIDDFMLLKPFDSKEVISFQLENNTSHVLAVILDVDDCTRCFLERSLWEGVNTHINGVSVVGIISGKNQARVEYLLRRLDISIPFYFDPKGLTAEKLGLTLGVDTPLKLFMDRDGKVISKSKSLYGDKNSHIQYKSTILQSLSK